MPSAATAQSGVGNLSGSMKVVFACLVTALVTGSASYFGQEAGQSSRINSNSIQVERLGDDVRQLVTITQDHLIAQTRLLQRFDDYVAHQTDIDRRRSK